MNVDFKLYHQLALQLFINLDPGSEHEAHDLLSSVLFNDLFINDLNSENIALSSLEVLRIGNYHPLTSATRETIQTSKVDLLKDTCLNFEEIQSSYLQSLTDMALGLVKSRLSAFTVYL